MLVKVKAVALNPTDWKSVYQLPELQGTIVGVDYAGIVEKVADGDTTRQWRKGDRVAGGVHGCESNLSFPQDGAFGEWTVGRTGNALKLPDTISFEEGATLAAGLLSCGQGLYQQLGLPLPNNSPTAPSNSQVLIYGGSTATGTLAIQLAKLSGLTVLTTCSPRNFELVKSRGADFVFDYNSLSAIQDIKKVSNSKLSLIFDCVGEGNSPGFCYKAMGDSGGKYSTLLFPVECPRKDITVMMVVAYTSYGSAFTKFKIDFPLKMEDYLFGSKFFEICEVLLAEGKLKPHPIEHRPNGLEGISDGLEDMKNGKVSGKKLVYTVS
ncbi:hypothetical protein F5884DRAFT_683803 [Xylogone sp. PMI_703]|nr:hypothetical protein F5884DRAFT_683803 [Xylogone sp. PMI_703]